MNVPDHGEAAERQDLARILPAPGTPGMSPVRLQALEDSLMNEITRIHSIPAPVPPAPARPVRRIPRWSLVAAPLVVAAVAAVAVSFPGSGTHRGEDITALSPVVEVEPASTTGAVAFLDQAADAASRQQVPTAGADQFVYVESKVGFSRQTEQRTFDGRVELDAVHKRQVWLAQTPGRDGLIREGGDDIVLHGSGPAEADPETLASGSGVLTAAQVAALPTDPKVLLDKIYAETEGRAPGKNAAAFSWIGDTVAENIVPPKVMAALWRAAALIPGVRLVDDSTDAAGRHGKAIAHVADGERTEYIFDDRTHLFLGERSYLVKNTSAGKAGLLTGTSAVLSRGVVDEKGEIPAQADGTTSA
ncbi:CU044_5270 family protein [Streptomyces sp. NPDC086091]|uniref:CU044_5270 family protein n=1 Tax=Streptomyces sp. NPDC086091 TaxID=3365751 RepID=UPI003801D803